MTKVCGNTKCREEKPLCEFGKNKRSKDGIDYRCKECRKSAIKVYTAEHKQARNEYNRKYKQNNSDELRAYNKEYCKHYYLAHKEERKPLDKEYRRMKSLTDPIYRLRRNLRRRLHNALKGKSKAQRTLELLGCSIDSLKQYLESLFKPGMSWDNYSYEGWHVDHKTPLAAFDLTDPNQLQKACHFTNLQPLWAKENLSKSDSL